MSEPPSELDAVGRLAEDFLARYRRGERPPLTEYTEQYPELAGQIRDLFPALVVMEELGSVGGDQKGSFKGSTPDGGQVPGRLGDYRIVREVGRGGMGVVYEAVQESLGRHVALKVLSSHGLLPPTHLERFRREARAAARLHHTNIVPIHGVGEYNGLHYYAMQLIQGKGLDEVLGEVRRLRRGKDPPTTDLPPTDLRAGQSHSLARSLLTGPFDEGAAPLVSPAPPAAPPADPTGPTELTGQTEAQYFRAVARMGAQVAAGLDYAHKQGILHRDSKPSNLLLDARGTVWITDFGLAKAEGADELSHTGDIVGTLRYMAPERFTGCSDPRSDVYGLGITLYEMLTLRPAFEDASRARLIQRVTHEEPPRPRKLDRSIPCDLETIVLKAIEKEPGRRYPTAGDLGEDLGRFLAGEPIRARRIGVGERAVKWVRRRPALAALLAVSATAVVALVVGVLIHDARLGEALRQAGDNLDEARRADREKTRQLAIAQVREAQALRNGGRAGRRFESLEALKKARDFFRALDEPDAERTLELRNEVIACLALADLRPGSPVPAGRGRPLTFDPARRRFVRAAESGVSGIQNDKEGDLIIRSLEDDREEVFLPGFGVPAVAAAFSPDGLYLAVHYERGERHSYVWDLGSRTAVVRAAQGSNPSLAAFRPDGRQVALALPDHSVRLYELPSGAVAGDLAPGTRVDGMHFHPDGRRLAVVSWSDVQLRDVDGGRVTATFRHAGVVACLAWRDDGRVFATGCHDNDIYLWEVASPTQPVRKLKGHFGGVIGLAFSRRGDLLLSDSWDSTGRLWDAATGQALLSRPGGGPCAFGPDDRALADGTEVADGRECRTFHGPHHPRGVSLSPRGRLLASASADGVRLWDLGGAGDGGKEIAFLPAGTGARVCFEPGGDGLFTDGGGGLRRWPVAPDPETGGLRVGPPEHVALSARAPFLFPDYDPDFAFSADGRTVALSPQRGQLLVFSRDTPRQKILIESPYLRHPAFSPDGKWLATGNWQGRGARVWEARTGRLAQALELAGGDGLAACVAFSPDGNWLVTGTDVEYRFWAVGSWKKGHAVPRRNAGMAPAKAAFAPDGTVLAVLHDVSEVRLVDPATGRAFARLPAGGGPHGFSPDGSQLFTDGGKGGDFQVWDLRLIRRQLREVGLDWDLAPYPPAPEKEAKPLRVRVLAAEPPPDANELDARAHVERGSLFVRLRQFQSGAYDFTRAAALDPKRPPWEEAVRAYSEVIGRHPREAEAYHQRAHAQESLGRREEAIDDLTRAVGLAPQRRDLLVCRGKMHLRRDQKDKAAADLLKATDGRPEEANRLARELAASPNFSGLAVELAKQAVRQDPARAPYWNTLGIAHYRTRQWAAAVETLEEAEKRAPGQNLGCNAFLLALCRHQLGDPAAAKDHYDRAVRWCQENEGKLTSPQQQELKALRAEAQALLQAPPLLPMRATPAARPPR